MTAGQPLRGLVGQSMSGRRKQPTAYSYSYPAGSYTWTCPAAGVWRLVLWGAGGGATNAANGGGSGALYIAERLFAYGETVALVVGACPSTGQDGVASTATLRSGEVITAGGGKDDATGGLVTANRNTDIVYAGSAGGVGGTAGTAGLGGAGGTGGTGGARSGGAGAPGYGTHRGGDGQVADVTRSAEVPAAGASENTGSGNAGGDGLILIYRIKSNS